MEIKFSKKLDKAARKKQTYELYAAHCQVDFNTPDENGTPLDILTCGFELAKEAGENEVWAVNVSVQGHKEIHFFIGTENEVLELLKDAPVED